MNISDYKRGDTAIIEVVGDIKSVSEIAEFKSQFSKVCLSKPKFLEISFIDSSFIASAVIGALLQKKEIDKLQMSVIVSKKELFDSIARLGLVDILNVRIK